MVMKEGEWKVSEAARAAMIAIDNGRPWGDTATARLEWREAGEERIQAAIDAETEGLREGLRRSAGMDKRREDERRAVTEELMSRKAEIAELVEGLRRLADKADYADHEILQHPRNVHSGIRLIIEVSAARALLSRHQAAKVERGK